MAATDKGLEEIPEGTHPLSTTTSRPGRALCELHYWASRELRVRNFPRCT